MKFNLLTLRLTKYWVKNENSNLKRNKDMTIHCLVRFISQTFKYRINCLLKHVVEENTQGEGEGTG